MEAKYSYQSRIVCFIDILGFANSVKQTIRNTEESKQLLDSTCRALAFFAECKTILMHNAKVRDMQITQFSDSIVISFPSENGNDLYLSLALIKFIQVSVLREFGILLRGGIVIGDLIHTDKILIGPAMIAAYDIESKCAFSPRIVLDPKVVYRFLSIRKEIEPGNEKRNIVHKDLDDTSYIDYFNIDDNEIDGFDEDARYGYFRILCQKVADNVNSTDMSIRVKYLWMRNKIKGSSLFRIPKYAAAYKEIVTDKK